MYSIDGVPLKNTTYGWRLKREGTDPFTPITRSLVDFNTSGRDGTIQVRGYTTTPTITLNITTPLASLDDLRQLLRLGSSLTLTSDSSRALKVELVTLVPQPWSLVGNGIYLVSAVFRCPEVYWRDVNASTWGPTTIPSSGYGYTVLQSSTAPVRDGLVSVSGSITGLAVQASNGTYFSYPPNIPSGTWLTFDSASGRAWTGSSAFAQATEVTGSIANGRGPYFLECAGMSNPATTGSILTVTMNALSGSQIAYRARNAYDL